MRYRPFGETGLVVSEFALGGGNFGQSWGYGATPEEAGSIFRAYVEAGGNFIDTADVYQFGESERLIADFVGGARDDFVIASKYTGGTGPHDGFGVTGNSRKAMVQAVEGSLKRLKTDHIDIYWAHYPDFMTPIDEIMRGFEDLVSAGKIHYAGLSDFPAWRVARGATLAELRGWAPLVGVQTEYSLVERSSDRELLPMAAAMGMGVVCWGVLGGGLLSGKYRRGEEGRADTFKVFVHHEADAQKTAILDALVEIGHEIDATPGEVAIAWVRGRGLIPILGPRSHQQVLENLHALDTSLSPEQMRRLTEVSAIPLGFPHEMLASELERKAAEDPRLARLDRPAKFVA